MHRDAHIRAKNPRTPSQIAKIPLYFTTTKSVRAHTCSLGLSSAGKKVKKLCKSSTPCHGVVAAK